MGGPALYNPECTAELQLRIDDGRQERGVIAHYKCDAGVNNTELVIGVWVECITPTEWWIECLEGASM
ncbi:hypothetical protein T01_1934 [Trichinella spiralis]|uniref:Uncharacterized protein n=1 Tax=Trichinella spiralis TaxID=6334 RepID=A0A0V1BFT7_TRISP|nr:hypothetical protein T01_1934 [Trichinella spiralis]